MTFAHNVLIPKINKPTAREQRVPTLFRPVPQHVLRGSTNPAGRSRITHSKTLVKSHFILDKAVPR